MSPSTPFEHVHVRAATAGLRIVESLALNQMIAQAHAYEYDMSKLRDPHHRHDVEGGRCLR